MNVRGKTAIVTGASTGIGREVARELASRSASVVLASRNRAKLETLAEELAPYPGPTLVVATDVTDHLAVEAMARRTLEVFGSIDILINNAGSGLFAPIAGGSLENARRLFDVNFWGAVQAIQATVPYMQSKRSGHIVNVSSVAGWMAPPHMGMYAATKFALRAMSDALRVELAGTGVSVSTIYPGLTQTQFTENMVQEVAAPNIPPIVRWATPATVARRIMQAINWGWRDVFVSPEDIAAVGFSSLAPYAADWVMRAFMGPQRIMDDFTLPREERSSAAEREDAEPPAEPA
jgi:short-subunit dehydrogenase